MPHPCPTPSSTNDLPASRISWRGPREWFLSLGLPRWILCLLIGFLVIKFLIVWYVPVNDIDSISSYLVRNYYAQFGPLEKTATFEFLYTFPSSFDFMFGPFLKLHWFEALPNFLIFLLMLFVLFRQAPPNQHVTVFALLFSCQVLLTQMSSGKNDMALGVFALTAWWAIYSIKGSRFRIPLALFAIAALIGTKWMGVPLAGLLLIALLVEVVQERKLGRFLLTTLFLLPLLLWVGSFQTYVTNWLTYGSPIYLSPAIDASMNSMAHVTVAHNTVTLLKTLILKSFDLGPYLLDVFVTKGALYKFFTQLLANIRYYATPSADYSNVGGVVFLICVGLSLTCLFLKNVERSLKVSAAIALIHMAILVKKVELYPSTIRYLCSVYVLMILPSAYVLHRFTRLAYLRHFILAFGLLTMIPTLLMQREHMLMTATEVVWSPESETDSSNPPILVKVPSMFRILARHQNPPVTPYPYWPPHLPDRDALQFMIWSGVMWSYDYFRAMVPHTASLMMVNFDTDMNSPVAIGPFLRLRDPANTEMVNVRTGTRFGNWRDNIGHFQYIMAWDGAFSDPRYCLVLSQKPFLTLHRLKDEKSCPKPYILS
jgi:hypothetical protein